MKQSEHELLVTPRLTLATLPTYYIFIQPSKSYLYPPSGYQPYPAGGICLVDGDSKLCELWRNECLRQCKRGYAAFTLQLGPLEYLDLEFDFQFGRLWGFRWFLELDM